MINNNNNNNNKKADCEQPNEFWTFQRVLEIAQKFKNQKEFIQNCKDAFFAAKFHGW